jgi:2-polyprenyl-3-methyl-5-hydroxy-6-metoxy-1,4-benzoquinol methylase
MEINDDYTIEDHNSRDEDSYALLKYKLTLRFLQRLSSKGHLSILEIGCGSGLFTSMAVSHGYSMYAIEPDSASLALAEIRNSENHARLENVGVFEFAPKNKFDVVVMHDVLEHIEEDSKAVEKVSGFLKVGCTLIISVPAHQYLFGYHDVQLGHFRRYSKKVCRKCLQTTLQ